MTTDRAEWVFLVYKIPTQPSRLRLQIWRTLQRMGALYVQDGVCLLPARDDLVENMQYVATAVEEMGGTSLLFGASSLLPDGTPRLEADFRILSDKRLEEIAGRLERIGATLDEAASLSDLERVEGEIKRERVAYLRARRLSYFGGSSEAKVDALFDRLSRMLDDLHRASK